MFCHHRLDSFNRQKHKNLITWDPRYREKPSYLTTICSKTISNEGTYKLVQSSVQIAGLLGELGPLKVSPHLIPLQVLICAKTLLHYKEFHFISHLSFKIHNLVANPINKTRGKCRCKIVKQYILTTGSGASSCLHITQGTPV